MYCTR